MTEARVNPPSGIANNQDVFIWALYMLGGADHDVDVEEIYLKSFELAPARLGWRTHPEIPDYKKTSKALQSVEASTHVGLVHRPHQHARRLTTEGVAWLERYRAILERTYSAGAPVDAAATNEHERRRRSVRASAAWSAWKDGDGVDVVLLADALECSPASPRETWQGRILELERAAQVLTDDELSAFANMARSIMDTGRGTR